MPGIGVREMTIISDRYDMTLSLLVLEAPGVVHVRISANVTGDFGNVTDFGVGAGLRGEDCRFGVGLPGSGTS